MSASATGTASLPPGPALSQREQTLRFLRDQPGFLDDCRQRFGDTFTLSVLGWSRLVVVGHPQGARELFIQGPDAVRAGSSPLDPVLGASSMAALDGEAHARRRKLMLPPLHAPNLERHRATIADLAAKMVDRWPVGTPIQMLAEARALTLDTILRTVFGLERGDRIESLRAEFRRIRFAPARAEIDRHIYAEIADRRRGDGAEADSVLALLLAARDELDRPIADSEIRDELVTLLSAGYETTSVALAWAFERVLRHPAVERRLRDEISHGGDKYTDAVVKETLRVRPPLHLAVRRIVEPVTIQGQPLPAGTDAAVSIYLVHRHESSYEDPDAFRPERFLDGAPDPHAWVAFGGGSRRCLGAAFALLELKTVVQVVFESVRLGVDDAMPEGVQRRGVTFAPAKGATVVVGL